MNIVMTPSANKTQWRNLARAYVFAGAKRALSCLRGPRLICQPIGEGEEPARHLPAPDVERGEEILAAQEAADKMRER